MNDDLYLRDGETYTNGVYYPEEPQEQVEEIQQKRGVIAASYPVMEDVAEWFANSIADAKDLTNIDLHRTEINGVNVSLRVSVEAQVLAYHLLAQALQDKSQEFEEWRQNKS